MSTLIDQRYESGATNDYFGYDATRQYLGQGFTPTIKGKVVKFGFQLKTVGSPSGTITGYLYSNNSGVPGTLLGTYSNMSATSLTASYTWYYFTITSESAPIVIPGQTYHLVLGSSALNTTNYIHMKANASDAYTGGAASIGSSTPTWTAQPSVDEDFREYYEPIMTVGELWNQPNLVSLYHFNGGSVDSSESGNNGTDTSITYTDYGRFNKAASFNGTSSKITFGSTPDITSDFTIMFWANCDQVGSDTGLITKRNAFAGMDFQIFEASSTSGDIDFFGGGVNIFGASGCRLEVGKWVHVAITRSGNNWVIYKNGSPTKFVTQAATIGTGDTWRFGVLGNDVAAYYKGRMDEVAVFSIALSQKQIANYYSWSLGRFAKII